MKKFIILCMMLAAMRLTAQNINPAEYEPLPVPEWSAPVNHTGQEQFLFTYELQTATEKVTDEIPPSGPGTEGYSEPAFTGDEAVEEDAETDNFTTLRLITNTTVYPYRTCVKLFITFPDGAQFVGSGSLIGQCVVLTAGHCVHSREHGGWARSITVVPAYNNNSRPYGQASAMALYSWSGWTVSRNFDWDMGMIKLNQPIANNTGWLGFGWNSNNNFFKNNTFHTLSYPAAPPYNGERMYYSYGTFDDVQTHKLYFNRISYGGSSGGGSYNIATNGNRYVYSVLSHGLSNGKTGHTRITRDKFNFILQVVNKACYLTMPVGMQDKEKAGVIEFLLYPNPASNRINIKTEVGQCDLKVMVYDILGKVVREDVLRAGSQSLSISTEELTEGFYAVRLDNGSGTATRTFIKVQGR